MRYRTINLIAAGGCFACGIAFTLMHRPVATIATLVVLGVANLAFLVAR